MIQHNCGGWLIDAKEKQLPSPDTRLGREPIECEPTNKQIKVTTMSKRQLILKITSPLWFLLLIALGVCAYIGAKLRR